MTQSDRILEVLGWVAVLGIWILTLAYYYELPETIAIHFNAAGKADGSGHKTTILGLPIISTIMFIGLTILNKHPNVFDYPVRITEENALYQYRNASRMLRFIKLAVIIVFGVIVYRTIQYTNGDSDGLGAWFLPATMSLIFIPTIYFLIKAFKRNAKE